jgi:hypothetical protein
MLLTCAALQKIVESAVVIFTSQIDDGDAPAAAKSRRSNLVQGMPHR